MRETSRGGEIFVMVVFALVLAEHWWIRTLRNWPTMIAMAGVVLLSAIRLTCWPRKLHRFEAGWIVGLGIAILGANLLQGPRERFGYWAWMFGAPLFMGIGIVHLIRGPRRDAARPRETATDFKGSA